MLGRSVFEHRQDFLLRRATLALAISVLWLSPGCSSKGGETSSCGNTSDVTGDGEYPGPCRAVESGPNGANPFTVTRSYDECGRLIALEEDWDTNGIVDAVESYHYDPQGYLSQKARDGDPPRNRPDGAPDEIWQYGYDQHQRLRKVEWDTDGDGTANICTTFTYEHHDQPTREDVDYSLDGEIDSQIFHQFDAADREIRREFDGSGPGDLPDGIVDRRTVYEYDSSGLLITEVRDDDADGRDDSAWNYQYGEAGHLQEASFDLGVDGVIELAMRYHYDGSGNLLLVESDQQNDGRVDQTTAYSYDCWHRER